MLALLVLLVSSMLNSTAKVTAVSTKRMEADSQERQLLDRMAVDFAQMVKRKDVSYYVKTAGTAQTGNDLIAFFSAVPCYYPSSYSYESPISLVAYRVNSNAGSTVSYNRLERMAKNLQWNGASASPSPGPIRFNTTICLSPILQQVRRAAIPVGHSGRAPTRLRSAMSQRSSWPSRYWIPPADHS